MSLSPFADRLNEKYFGDAIHPYALFEDMVRRHVAPDKTLLDAGCGYGAPVLLKFAGAAKELIGVDLVNFDHPVPGITLLRRDLADTKLPDRSVDVIMSRSVMEHIADPVAMYREMSRLLRPNGYFIFLTGNMWDYSGIIAQTRTQPLPPIDRSPYTGARRARHIPCSVQDNTRRAVRGTQPTQV